MYITECDFYVELLLWAVLYFMFMLFYFDENARESSWKFRHLGVIYRGERSCCSGKFTRVLVFTVESKKRRVLSCLTPASSLTSSFCGVTVLWTLKAWTFLWKTLLVVFYFISSLSLSLIPSHSLSPSSLPSYFSLSFLHLSSSLFLFSFSVWISFRMFVLIYSYTYTYVYLLFNFSLTLSFIFCFLSFLPIYSHFHTFLLFMWFLFLFLLSLSFLFFFISPLFIPSIADIKFWLAFFMCNISVCYVSTTYKFRIS